MGRAFRSGGAAALPAVLLLITACAGPAAPGDRQPGAPAEGPRRTKTLTIGVTSGVDAMSNVGGTTTTGGWVSVSEVHSDALVTSDYQTRKPVGRLAERVPTLEDGSLSLLPDGRMRVVYQVRKGVTWQDGTPLTAQD